MTAQSDEISSLKRTVRDVVAISSLPSIWAHYSIEQVVDSLAATLVSCLNLEFALVLTQHPGHVMQAGFGREGKLDPKILDPLIAEVLPQGPRSGSMSSCHQTLSSFGEGRINTCYLAIGPNFKNGSIVVASKRSQFPTEEDMLVLNLSSNQTNVILESKWAQQETASLLKQAEENRIRLSEAKKLAEAANDMKSSFLANMSHEIRTPLGAILGFAELLKKHTLDVSDRSKYLEVITRSGQSLSRIIDDILDLSKIEAGKMEMESKPVSLTTICAEVIAMFRDRALHKGIELIFDDSNLPHFSIDSDEVRIRQVLVNLLGNAIKFTANGSVRLSGRYVSAAYGKTHITLTVTDTGVGIPESVAHSLFKPFVQGDNKYTRRFGGTGLGLIISKRLGEAMGGDVSLTRSEEGQGSVFTFEFLAQPSLAKKQDSRGNSTFAVDQENLLLGLNILVVDDSIDNRELMEILLTGYGARIQLAENGVEAVEKANQEEFDLILMDIQMPLLDGYGALEKLKEMDYQRPIFALTAHAMNEERDRALAAGFTAHVTKPIHAEELLQSILTHCGQSPRAT